MARYLTSFIAAIVAIPILVVMANLFMPGDDVWTHLYETMLFDLLKHTGFLLLATLIGTFIIGTGSAWLVAACEFPGRRFFHQALVLPFAFPTYVLGYVMLDLCDSTGPVHDGLVSLYGGELPFFPDIRSGPGVAFVMTLAFYPYVYLLSRTAFTQMGSRAMEVARSLGDRPLVAFWRVVLPMSRPWIFGGLLLVAMETLADFGTVSVFNYDTFTTGIYKAWYGLFSLPAAAQLASFLLIFALVLLGLEKWLQSRRRFYQVSTVEKHMEPFQLKGWLRVLAPFSLLGLFSISFLIPVLYLLYWSLDSWSMEVGVAYGQLFLHTLITGLAAGALVVLGTLVLCYGVRLNPTRWMQGITAFASTGYALPGTVLAVGTFIPLAWLDDRVYDLGLKLLDTELPLIFNGTLVTMLLAYVVRFLAVARQSISASLEKIRPNMDEAARSLGSGRFAVLWKIHLPLLKPGLVAAYLMVLIDTMKEMPITLMTRPFDWDTLAIRIFELTSEGEYERAALPSLILVLTGLIPVFILGRFESKGSNS